MQRTPREIRFLVPAFIVLFVGLILLALFLIAGQSSRARILVEYEADRTASELLDAFRAQGSVDSLSLDPRVRAFGIYRPDGSLVAGVGAAPQSLGSRPEKASFRFDGRQGTLVLVRPLGMGGPGMQGMMRGMMGGAGRSLGGPGGGAALYLVMDVSGFIRGRTLSRAAALAAPLLIGGIAAAFLLLLTSNMRMRRRTEEQETLARLGHSARTLAHEIRNPLSAIRIQTGLLRKRLPESSSRELDVIDEEAERLNVLSRRVGDFLRNPGGTPEPIRVVEFLRDLAGRLPCPVRLSADIPPLTVSFDRELLRSVIENLVRNACESYGETGEEGIVDVSASRQGGRVLIVVRDHGKGIPPDLADEVFDPFFTDKVHGSGVGLPLARRFVEGAGGTLTLVPAVGGGTEARIALRAQGDA
jgi:signal transduction histidine kinase